MSLLRSNVFSTRPWLWPLGAAALLLAAADGLMVGQFGLLGAVAVMAALAVVVLVARPETGLIASLVTIILGQLVRIQLPGSDTTVILNDVLLPPLIYAWLLCRLASRRWSVPRSSLIVPIFLMVATMIFSLYVNRYAYGSTELLTGALYIVRWIEYAAIFFIAYDYFSRPGRPRRYLWLIAWVGLITAALGFIQLRLFPDFSFMVPRGWDPHVGRLLSTWFDPNFLGGFFVVLVTVALALALSRERGAWKWWLVVAILLPAIILTYSRSAYVALAAGLGFVTLFRSRLLFAIGALSFLAVVIFIPRVQERVIGIRTIDETARYRLISWQRAATVFRDHPWFGVGYNVYKFVQVQYRFLDRPTEHSASGSDSSLLTVAVTTGVVGLTIYLWLLFLAIREAWRTWWDKTLPMFWRSAGLGLVAGIIALFIHSQFVNSLLYPHLMETMWVFLALVMAVRQERTV